MAFIFQCPYCGCQTTVADEILGQTGPCARCGRQVTVQLSEGNEPCSSPKKKNWDVSRVLFLAGSTVVGVMGAVFLGVFLWGLAMWLGSWGNLKPVTRISNLETIAAAMNDYHKDHGHYPPAWEVDATGKPKHSWRVLLLPYLNHEDLYDRYNRDEPWDSAHNLRLAEEMPTCYACPGDGGSEFGETSYLVIAGPATIFNGAKTCKKSQINDGLGQTVLVVECVGSAVNWLKPYEVDADSFRWRLADGSPAVQGPHGPALVALADESVRLIDEQTSMEEFKAITTYAGGEPVRVEKATRKSE